MIRSSSFSYQVKFRSIDLENFEDCYFIVDQKLQGFFKSTKSSCIFIVANETNKTLSAVEDVIIQLSANGMTRKDQLVVIGGGYLQDIGTLVASLYMRGIDWIYMPSTLAAMGDSCIGGKSSINAGDVKNLVGNYYPPKEVIIDPSFVTTLPNLEIIAGISEIIKICYAKSFETFTESSKLILDWNDNRNQEILTEIIELSLRSKQYFVEEDEFDSGPRKLLNFGHSFGHALESASNYLIPHGVAVLLGMIAACQHPMSATNKETKKLLEICLLFSKMLEQDIINEISNLNYGKFSQALYKDKKNSNSDLVLILSQASGLEIVNIPFDQNAVEVATNAMRVGIEMVINEVR